MKKTNIFKLTTKQIAGMAVLTALAVVLALILHVPIFPAVGFLEYDMADIPIFLGTFMYGPFAGLIMTVLVSVIQGVTVSAGSGFIGILMHIFATGTYVLISGFIYNRNKTFKGALFSMGAGIVGWLVGMTLWNILLTPVFMGIPRTAVLDLLGFIVAFNAIKVGANSLATLLLYKRLRVLFGILFHTGEFKHKPKRNKELLTAGGRTTITAETANAAMNGETNIANQADDTGATQTRSVIAESEQKTYLLAEELAKTLRGGEVLLLNGELGAGKTTFTKGLAKALGVKETVTSPTFTLMKEYKGRLNLYHFDLYRIENDAETEELGFGEYLGEKDGVCVVEWNKFTDIENAIVVDIERIDESSRRFTFSSIHTETK